MKKGLFDLIGGRDRTPNWMDPCSASSHAVLSNSFWACHDNTVVSNAIFVMPVITQVCYLELKGVLWSHELELKELPARARCASVDPKLKRAESFCGFVDKEVVVCLRRQCANQFVCNAQQTHDSFP